MPSLALTLCILASIGWISVGVLALLSPARLARSYGIPVREASAVAYVRATGVRDLILGLALAANAFSHNMPALIVLCTGGAILAVADFCIAFIASGRRMHSEHGAHIGSAIGFAVLIVLLLHR